MKKDQSLKIAIYGFILILCIFFSFFYDKYLDFSIPLIIKIILIIIYTLIISLFAANLKFYYYVLFQSTNNAYKKKILIFYADLIILTGTIILFNDIIMMILKVVNKKEFYLMLISIAINYTSIFCLNQIIRNIYQEDNDFDVFKIRNIKLKPQYFIGIFFLLIFSIILPFVYSLSIQKFIIMWLEFRVISFFIGFSLLFLLFLFIFILLNNKSNKNILFNRMKIYHMIYNVYTICSIIIFIIGGIIVFIGNYKEADVTGILIVLYSLVYSIFLILFIYAKIFSLSLILKEKESNLKIIISPTLYFIISVSITICSMVFFVQ